MKTIEEGQVYVVEDKKYNAMKGFAKLNDRGYAILCHFSNEVGKKQAGHVVGRAVCNTINVIRQKGEEFNDKLMELTPNNDFDDLPKDIKNELPEPPTNFSYKTITPEEYEQIEDKEITSNVQ